ncbi:hypothetical protein MTES_0241 [Microbacterium testaceum StLB037]|uniref:Uncharacterized protein n=1 Tax=Microbacterium testaceum (strain StLB037) TaxID=979556 RepID=E8N8Z6_MICTS|nr:hypothetical protein [Microbacterium testaceum]BAJ73205.1 hypothetical protein MTES_0241 [Microbacterium testaceum StLB037]
MSDLQPAVGEGTFGEHLVENLFATWIDRDLKQRASGLTRAHVYRAVVELPPSGEAGIVRINDEVSLQARAVASAPIKKGEPVTAENISSLEAFWPVDVDPNSGWLAYIVVGESAHVAFDLRYNKQRNAELLSLADDYLDTVEAVQDFALRPAIDNLLSAAELTVQAQMLAQTQTTKLHNVRDRWLRENERLGNAPEGFLATLQRLRRERAAARYGDGVLRVTADEMPALIAAVRSMVQHAADQIGLVAADSTRDEDGAEG